MRHLLIGLLALGLIASAFGQISPEEAQKLLKGSERESDNEELESLRTENVTLVTQIEKLNDQIDELVIEKRKLQNQISTLEARLATHNPATRTKIEKLMLAQRPTLAMSNGIMSEYPGKRVTVMGYAKVGEASRDTSIKRLHPYGLFIKDVTGETSLRVYCEHGMKRFWETIGDIGADGTAVPVKMNLQMKRSRDSGTYVIATRGEIIKVDAEP